MCPTWVAEHGQVFSYFALVAQPAAQGTTTCGSSETLRRLCDTFDAPLRRGALCAHICRDATCKRSVANSSSNGAAQCASTARPVGRISPVSAFMWCCGRRSSMELQEWAAPGFLSRPADHNVSFGCLSVCALSFQDTFQISILCESVVNIGAVRSGRPKLAWHSPKPNLMRKPICVNVLQSCVGSAYSHL